MSDSAPNANVLWNGTYVCGYLGSVDGPPILPVLGRRDVGWRAGGCVVLCGLLRQWNPTILTGVRERILPVMGGWVRLGCDVWTFGPAAARVLRLSFKRKDCVHVFRLHS
ncbi:MAG: hypothetical protein V3U46_10030, partial [Acidimicrobiia bacterium]